MAPLVEQELLTFPAIWLHPRILVGIRVGQCLIFCVVLVNLAFFLEIILCSVLPLIYVVWLPLFIFSRCSVCPSSIQGFWLLFGMMKPFLKKMSWISRHCFQQIVFRFETNKAWHTPSHSQYTRHYVLRVSIRGLKN
jgi:hypothetical protein